MDYVADKLEIAAALHWAWPDCLDTADLEKQRGKRKLVCRFKGLPDGAADVIRDLPLRLCTVEPFGYDEAKREILSYRDE